MISLAITQAIKQKEISLLPASLVLLCDVRSGVQVLAGAQHEDITPKESIWQKTT